MRRMALMSSGYVYSSVVSDTAVITNTSADLQLLLCSINGEGLWSRNKQQQKENRGRKQNP